MQASDPLDGDLAVLGVLAIDILADDQLQDVAAILAHEVDQPEGERRLMTSPAEAAPHLSRLCVKLFSGTSKRK